MSICPPRCRRPGSDGPVGGECRRRLLGSRQCAVGEPHKPDYRAAAMDSPIFEMSAIVVLAVLASWLAARLHIPSIVVLLASGVVVGPGLQLIDPDALAGDLLLPFVSIAVGLILFEGGLSLRLYEIKETKRIVWLLVTAGVMVTWVLGSIAARFFLDIPPDVSVLLGAILVVSGPTVIGPILASIRPSRTVSSLLKWESIVIDPIGAMLAVVTFEFILLGAEAPSGEIVQEILRFLLAGAGAGVIVAMPTAAAIRFHLIPERLVPLVGISAALAAFAVADVFAPESGLLATTILGLILANVRSLRTEPIVQFSEVIQVLLVGVLFILLSARLTREQLSAISVGVLGLVAVLVLVARPLAVAVATWRSSLNRKEKVFLAGVAPRGIVAAAVASVFALELEEAGVRGAELLTPITFAVIVATVLIYGFGAGPLARRLGLAAKRNEGVLILGAGPVERAIGEALAEAGVPVLFSSTNRRDATSARMAGFRTYYGNLIDHELPWDVDLSGIGRLLALTPNDEVNTLACRRFAELFGAGETYQLAAAPAGPGIERTAADIGGRPLFGDDLTYAALAERLGEGQAIRKTALTEAFTKEDLADDLAAGGRVLFVQRGDQLLIETADDSRPLIERAQPGDIVLWIAKSPKPAQAGAL